jgi:fucose permease
MTANKSNSVKILIPILFSFFVMGMVDIVGLSTNYLKKDFSLDELTSSIIPMMVFFWFAVFSIPTGLLMNRIGRKKTVLLAILIGCISLILPFFFYNLYVVIFSFALLGIGNTILQVSLNPLAASVVDDSKLAGTLTFGQFIKAVCSFVGPIIASVAVKNFGDWKLILPVFAATSLISFIWLYYAPIKKEENVDTKQASFTNTLGLLKDSFILQMFLGILLIVGIDVCMNVNTPQLLEQRLGLTTDDATLGSSLYFGARTLGAFVGSILLLKISPSKFMKVNIIVAVPAFLVLMFLTENWLLFAAVFTIGLTCANVFSIIFSVAMQYRPQKANEISSLMIMGVAGGAIVTPLVGLVAKYFGLGIGFGVLLLSAVYIYLLSLKFEKKS